jgi:hypothetical protein
MDGLADWRRTVAATLDGLGYEGKRTALEALGATATVWQANHAPRFEITLSIPDGAMLVKSRTFSIQERFTMHPHSSCAGRIATRARRSPSPPTR